MVLKARSGWGYEVLVREVADSLHLRRFCRIALTDRVPDESTIRKLVRRLGAEVVEEIVMAVVADATGPGAQRRFVARAARIDSTVVESDIRYPTDLGLAQDAAGMLARESSQQVALRAPPPTGALRRPSFREGQGRSRREGLWPWRIFGGGWYADKTVAESGLTAHRTRVSRAQRCDSAVRHAPPLPWLLSNDHEHRRADRPRPSGLRSARESERDDMAVHRPRKARLTSGLLATLLHTSGHVRRPLRRATTYLTHLMRTCIGA